MPVAVFGTVASVADISARHSCVTTDPCGAHHARHESWRFRRCISLAASAPRRAPCPPLRAPNRSRPRRSASTRRCGGLVPPPAPLPSVVLYPVARIVQRMATEMTDGDVRTGSHEAAVTCAAATAAQRERVNPHRRRQCGRSEGPRFASLPRALLCYLVLPIVTRGSHAAGREPFPNMRDGRCRSSAARANCQSRNGLHYPVT